MTSASGAPEAAPPSPAEDAGVGEILSLARCSQGLSVADVALQLKFGARLIEALEKGRYAELPQGTIARGLVRSYARLLKLDPEPLVRRLAGAMAPPPAIDDSVPFRKPIPFSDSARRVNLGYVLLSLAVLAVVAAVMLGWPGERMGSADLAFVAAGKAPAERVSPAPVDTVQGVPVAAVGTPLAAAAPVRIESEPVPVAAAPPPDAAAAAAAPGADARPRRLVLRFAKASWVEVRGGDGSIITSQVNAAGTTRVVEGAPPFSLVIGNAQHVQLSLDERAIDLSQHTRLDVARLTLE